MDRTEQFVDGFCRAVSRWVFGEPTEQIVATCHGDPGAIAACEMILGWHDVAEQAAYAHGMSREAAYRFVAEQSHALSRYYSRQSGRGTP